MFQPCRAGATQDPTLPREATRKRLLRDFVESLATILCKATANPQAMLALESREHIMTLRVAEGRDLRLSRKEQDVSRQRERDEKTELCPRGSDQGF